MVETMLVPANALSRGVFQTITPSYAAEVVPMELRPYLTSYVNLCWVGHVCLRLYYKTDMI
jgi:hypothetical protein